jgi:hypothetical protein
MVKSAGFSCVEGWKFDNPIDLPFCRGFVKGNKRSIID